MARIARVTLRRVPRPCRSFPVSRVFAGLLVLAVIAAAVSALAPGLFGGPDASSLVAVDSPASSVEAGDTAAPVRPSTVAASPEVAGDIPDDIRQMADVDLAVAWLAADTELFADHADTGGLPAGVTPVSADGGRMDLLGLELRERGGAEVGGIYDLRANDDCAVLGDMPFGDRVRLTQKGFILRFVEDLPAGQPEPDIVMGIAGVAVGEKVVVGDPGVGVVLHGPADAEGVTLQLDTVRFRQTATMPLPPEEFAAIQRCRLTLSRVAEVTE